MIFLKCLLRQVLSKKLQILGMFLAFLRLNGAKIINYTHPSIASVQTYPNFNRVAQMVRTRSSSDGARTSTPAHPIVHPYLHSYPAQKSRIYFLMRKDQIGLLPQIIIRLTCMYYVDLVSKKCSKVLITQVNVKHVKRHFHRISSNSPKIRKKCSYIRVSYNTTVITVTEFPATLQKFGQKTVSLY